MKTNEKDESWFSVLVVFELNILGPTNEEIESYLKQDW